MAHGGSSVPGLPRAQVIAQLGTKDAPGGLGEAASEYEREMEATLHDAAACVLAFDARLQDERDASHAAAALQARLTPNPLSMNLHQLPVHNSTAPPP